MAAEKKVPVPNFQVVELVGRHVRLEPMSLAHLPALTAAGADPEIWKWFSINGATPETMRAFVEDALDNQRKGLAVPFTVFEQASGTIVGSTRFGAIAQAHRRAEIGWTFLKPDRQRSGINTEMKYLMLRHAFEVWGLIRVEFKTDSFNEKSRNALKRIGASEEGTLRNHMITFTGRVRHSVSYSITSEDWPRVKQHLESLMAVGRHSDAAGSVGKGLPTYENGR